MSRQVFRLILLAFVSAGVVLAQEPDYVLKVDVPVVSVDVTVQDSSGNTIKDLPAGAFEVYENGVRQTIRYFLPVSTLYDILLLFDRSGSTQDKWPLMQRAVAGFITNLRPQDRIAIATFDADFQVQQQWTADRKSALLTLPQLLQASRIGETNFYDAVLQGLRREFRKERGRRALVVLTDGRDTSFFKDVVNRNRVLDSGQERPFQTVLKAARTERIPIYVIAFNTDKNLQPNISGGDEYRRLRTLFPESDVPKRYLAAVRQRMEQLAEVSGGRVLFPEALEDIVPLYQQVGRELGTSYSLGYVSSNPAKDGSFRRIEVRTTEGGLRLSQSRDGYSAK
jgi:Ca-activated chloride channel family protein